MEVHFRGSASPNKVRNSQQSDPDDPIPSEIVNKIGINHQGKARKNEAIIYFLAASLKNGPPGNAKDKSGNKG